MEKRVNNIIFIYGQLKFEQKQNLNKFFAFFKQKNKKNQKFQLQVFQDKSFL